MGHLDNRNGERFSLLPNYFVPCCLTDAIAGDTETSANAAAAAGVKEMIDVTVALEQQRLVGLTQFFVALLCACRIL